MQQRLELARDLVGRRDDEMVERRLSGHGQRHVGRVAEVLMLQRVDDGG